MFFSDFRMGTVLKNLSTKHFASSFENIFYDLGKCAVKGRCKCIENTTKFSIYNVLEYCDVPRLIVMLNLPPAATALGVHTVLLPEPVSKT